MIQKKYIDLIKAFLKGDLFLDYKNDQALGRAKKIKTPAIGNYVRISSLELCVREIDEKKIPGAVAEVGVYKGGFARYMNQAFPDRKLYLFDTFEGFDKKDIHYDVGNSFSTGKQDFSNTSVPEVMKRMVHQENCIIKQGWFPDSAQDVEDTFCFVSLDADLYKPIYDGLEFFYPRLNAGGYIFIHDYNNANYSGAKEAVRDFCKKQQISYVPMTDAWGTAVIAK